MCHVENETKISSVLFFRLRILGSSEERYKSNRVSDQEFDAGTGEGNKFEPEGEVNVAEL